MPKAKIPEKKKRGRPKKQTTKEPEKKARRAPRATAKSLAVIGGLPQEMTSGKAMQQFAKRQEALIKFVTQNLEEGVDYGPMWQGDAKANIYKAGCEKTIGWLNLKDTYFPATGEHVQLGQPEKTVCQKCYLVRRADMSADVILRLIKELGGPEFQEGAYRMIAVSEGYGGAIIDGTTVRDANVALKKARIRAMKDATLGLGLSSRFTQDHGSEDPAEAALGSSEDESTQKPPRRSRQKAKARRSMNDVVNEGLKLLGGVRDQKQRYKMEQHLIRLQANNNLGAATALVAAWRRRRNTEG